EGSSEEDFLGDGETFRTACNMDSAETKEQIRERAIAVKTGLRSRQPLMGAERTRQKMTRKQRLYLERT
ncbi:unnamed protein product, partial [Amoebophrya sp. A25]